MTGLMISTLNRFGDIDKEDDHSRSGRFVDRTKASIQVKDLVVSRSVVSLAAFTEAYLEASLQKEETAVKDKKIDMDSSDLEENKCWFGRICKGRLQKRCREEEVHQEEDGSNNNRQLCRGSVRRSLVSQWI